MHASSKSNLPIAAIAALLLSTAGASAAGSRPPAPDQTLGPALLGAEVYAAGTLHKSAGATGVDHTDTGIYLVGFNRNVEDNCIAVATPYLTVVHIYTETNNSNAVYVVTTDNNGNHVDANFTLIVLCTR
ncbi:MAG TPA: hypothetical protein VGG69_07685 [Rhizomicrobium sp.]